MKAYQMTVAGVTRHLPLRPVNDHLDIASFIMLGDTELVEACAEALADRLPDSVDFLVAPETKAIPLVHAMSRITGMGYAVLRKNIKVYMADAIAVPVRSITTDFDQQLILDGVDAAKMKGRKVCVIDDVVSTGGSLKAIDELLSRVDCQVVARAAVLLEDGGYDTDNLIYLEKLPVFPH